MYKTDEELDKKLRKLYKDSKEILNTRTKGSEQYNKYHKLAEPLKTFVIGYEEVKNVSNERISVKTAIIEDRGQPVLLHIRQFSLGMFGQAKRILANILQR